MKKYKLDTLGFLVLAFMFLLLCVAGFIKSDWVMIISGALLTMLCLWLYIDGRRIDKLLDELDPNQKSDT